ncbi:MAG TPA: prephenate dehydratase domain-containing protein [Longimicrobiales bacterium]|nr:prephenate dehydratase domain-containing protein [Longimicrobiales bacterium]
MIEVSSSPDAPAAGAPRVAFQGEAGAFSEEAVAACFGEAAEAVPCREFRDVGAAVVSGAVDFGLLPIENTLAGGVTGAYDVLVHGGLEVVREVTRPIRHCLLGAPGSSIEGVRRVISHPVALAQVARFVAERPWLQAVAVYDTAGAARDVAAAADPTLAAVASRQAGRRYGLEVLAADIQDRADNQTRFLGVARAGAPRPADDVVADRWKTMLVAETPNRPGALLELLLPFAERGVNLTKIESRPGEAPWTYRFFLELDGRAGTPAVDEALEAVRGGARTLRVLGSFPAAVGESAGVA